MIIPPTSAPIKFPIPPKTTMTKARRRKRSPTVGLTYKIGSKNGPVTPRQAVPNPKVIA